MAYSSATPPPLLLLLFLLSHFSLGTPSIDSEKSTLLFLRSNLRPGNTLRGWDESTSPCEWRGVGCNAGNNTVISLALPRSHLSGSIPVGIFGNLTSLTYLSLRSNSLTSPLPSDLSLCTSLRKLYLQENHLSEPFPSPVLRLTSLTHLVLSGNNLTGPIPSELADLANLDTLKLDRNNFSGNLPDLDLPKLDNFNVSLNAFLHGPIPSTLREYPKSSFRNTSLCGVPLPSCSAADDGSGGDLSRGAIAGISVAVVAVAILLLLCFCRWRSRRGNAVAGMDPEVAEAIGARGIGGARGVRWFRGIGGSLLKRKVGEVERSPREKKKLVFFRPSEARFEIEELLRAPAEVLGKGTFGTTYKVMLGSGPVVTVKRLTQVEIDAMEFQILVETIANGRHPNLVDLEAYLYSKEEKILVSSYFQMGSLSGILHGSRGSGRVPLVWPTRLNVALTAARGIEYIHSRGPICHGNIRSSNILLNQSYDSVVSDYGIFQLAKPESNSNSKSTGYRAPEITDPTQATKEADVYSFGILLLEMVSGKDPERGLQDGDVDLRRWVLRFPRDEWSSEVLDMELLRFQNAEEQMLELLQLAIDCCSEIPVNRPSMSEVVVQIAEIRRESLDLDPDFKDRD